MSKYISIEELGRGGFGFVEKVRKGSDLFARKTFCPAPDHAVSSYPGLRKRFKREVLIQSELNGELIMPILENDLNGDSPWFLMPLADDTYDKKISADRQSGSIDITALSDILASLEYLHDEGFVHRDLNPKNILLHEGTWKLSDLGAVLPPSGHTVTLTNHTQIYTEAYCAPEQKREFHLVTSAADIYSFGCILHDLYGAGPSARVPYTVQSAPGDVGIIIEKCTAFSPKKRPSIEVLRPMLMEILLESGGQCKVTDADSESWLEKLKTIDSWSEDQFDEFASFFTQQNLKARSAEHPSGWVYDASTPFMTRIKDKHFIPIVTRQDGLSEAIVEKYCEWVKDTSFEFNFSDTICTRLAKIFDHGGSREKALAFAALTKLGSSHHRYYVMSAMLKRACEDVLTDALGRRLAIEIRTEELEYEFRDCIESAEWDVKRLHPQLKALVKGKKTL